MPRPKVSDGEFIKLWRQHNGDGRKLAEVLNCDESNTWRRRRRLEQRHNISLEPGNKRPDMAEKNAHLAPTVHKPRINLEITNGVVLVFSDAHYWPGIVTTAHRALLKFCGELKPKAVICNGDAFDGASISRHAPLGWESTPTVREELKACDDRLGEIEEAAAGARLLWPIGNHDARFEARLAQVAPEYNGVAGFRLKDRYINWDPCLSVWINDETVVKHRFRNGIHSAHNGTLWSGKTIVNGHLHSLKVWPLTDYNGTRWGVDTGTLAEPDGPQFSYAEDNPRNWRSGFVVLTYWKGQLLQPETVRVLAPGVVDFRGHAIEVT